MNRQSYIASECFERCKEFLLGNRKMHERKGLTKRFMGVFNTELYL